MHLGNLRTALVSWLEARRHGGTWLLRIDDLDTPRNRPGSQTSILSDLKWLGLDWDGPAILQSHHRGRYHAWLSWLRRSGALFPCRCSRRMLQDQPIYPGTCRDREQDWGWQGKRLPSWRLRVPAGDPHGSGDVVLRRADGFIAYQLATVIDELCFGITDVVRGEDLRDALPAQYSDLSQPPPRFLHVRCCGINTARSCRNVKRAQAGPIAGCRLGCSGSDGSAGRQFFPGGAGSTAFNP